MQYVRSGNRYKSLESAEDLIVRGIVWDVIRLAQISLLACCHLRNITDSVNITNDSSNSGESSTATRNNTNLQVIAISR